MWCFFLCVISYSDCCYGDITCILAICASDWQTDSLQYLGKDSYVRVENPNSITAYYSHAHSVEVTTTLPHTAIHSYCCENLKSIKVIFLLLLTNLRPRDSVVG
jgi:hypothetical protein